jgi:DNA-binding transcriptional LysR family regulator
MTLKQMNCAIELSHTLNFRRASENLYISQPSLTYQIQTLEEEIGFELFYRSGKGATLTPAGEQFCGNLTHIRDEIVRAIENGKNFSSRFTESLSLSVPMRSAIYFLPHIMKQFQKEFPHVALNIKYIYGNERIDTFLKGEEDLIFGLEEALCHIPHIVIHPLFESHIYLVTQKEDPLATLESVTPKDLEGRRLMIGGGSPTELKKVQQMVVNTIHVETFNSADHTTTLTNIAAGNGICLSPGFCNDHTGEFSWIPFDTEVTMNCVIGMHKEDKREITKRFLEIADEFYSMSAIQL